MKMKWSRIALIGISAMIAAVISSLGTWLYINQKQQEKPFEQNNEESASEIILESEHELQSEEVVSELEAAFSDMVETIKKQAYFYSVADNSYGSPAYSEIVESVKEIFTSEYASLINNDTFNESMFSVVIDEYPIQNNCLIKSIQISIKHKKFLRKSNEGWIPREERNYFLQYIGEEGSFLSDSKQGSFFGSDFQVFTNQDKCFAIRLSSNNGHNVHNFQNMVSDWEADIFIPEDNGFIYKKVKVPILTSSFDRMSLIQEEEMIKVVVHNSNREEELVPECVFDLDEFAFHILPMSLISNPISYDFPGVFLGLSNSEGDIRTYYIRKEDGRICSDEYRDQIIFFRKGELFWLKQYIHNEPFFSSYTDDSGKDYEHRTGGLEVKKLLCAPFGMDIEPEFEIAVEDNWSNWITLRCADVPLFINEEYVCYQQSRFMAGSGTYSWASVGTRFDQLDNLQRFSFSYGMIPEFPEIKLADLVFGQKAVDLIQTDVSTYAGEPNPFIDFNDLVIKRNIGKWSLALPVILEYFHPGNASYNRYFKNDFVVLNNDVPSHLASNIEAMEMRGTFEWWNAKDLFRFPESNTFLVQYDRMLGVGEIADSIQYSEKVDLEIPVALNEYIVSISFMDADTQEMWKRELGRIE